MLAHPVPLGHASKAVVIQPAVLQANLHQALSSKHSIRICRAHESRTRGTATTGYIEGVASMIRWHRTNRAMSKDVHLNCKKNYLHLGLLLIQVPLHHGGLQRQSANEEQLHVLLGRTSKDRALMRKEGVNEKRISPNLSFPLPARMSSFISYIFLISQ